jgi:hypothetical protein
MVEIRPNDAQPTAASVLSNGRRLVTIPPSYVATLP